MNPNFSRCQRGCTYNVTVLALLTTFQAYQSKSIAAGVRIPNQSGDAVGQAEAVIAYNTSPSAAYYNPASLLLVEGTAVEASAWFWMPQIQHSSPGSSEEMDSPQLIPNLAFATDLHSARWRVGLGLNSVFGTAVDWGDDGPFRFLVSEAKLTVLNIGPAVAYRLTDTISIGASLNTYYADADLRNQVALIPTISPSPEGQFHFAGTGFGVGATASVQWKPHEKHAIGAVYRSGFEIPVSGDAQISSSFAAPIAAPTEIDLRLPAIATVGYAFLPLANLKLEVDLDWTGWETADEIVFKSENPLFSGTTIPLNWKSSFIYRFGAAWTLRENWTLQAGYAYWENSVPDETFSPLIPDSNYHSASFGISYRTQRWRFTAAYQANIWQDRTVDGSLNGDTVDGEWSAHSHVLALGLGFKF